jgi:hypothetical protein
MPNQFLLMTKASSPFLNAANLDKNTAGRCLLVSTRINGDSVFIAWGSKFLASQEIQSRPNFSRCFLGSRRI